MIVGGRIQERLNICGLSQAELARRVGQDQSTINSLIRGDQRSSTKLHQIARELRTTAAYLTGETDDPVSELPDVTVTAEERELLDLIRELAPKERGAVLTVLRSMVRANTLPTLHSPKQDFKRNGTDG